MVFKRRSMAKNAQKSLFRTPVKMEVYYDDGGAIYENENIAGYVWLLRKILKDHVLTDYIFPGDTFCLSRN